MPELSGVSLEVVTSQGRAKFQVELADNDAERERGLMFRKSLAPDRGMLFDFKAPREVAFWMRNTLIPLDIIFIRADGRVLTLGGWRRGSLYESSAVPELRTPSAQNLRLPLVFTSMDMAAAVAIAS